MLSRLIGTDTASAQLKEGLSASQRSMREIAHRVANSGNPDFAEAFDAALVSGHRGVERAAARERDMVALVDEAIHFEAATNLLSKVYQQVRSSIRER